MAKAQLNIFGEEVKMEDKKTKKKELKKISKIPEDKPLMVAYCGRRIKVSIAERLENIKLAKELKIEGDLAELEVLRQKLEKDFPELSQNRVTWHWEEEEQIVDGHFVISPTVSAGKKG